MIVSVHIADVGVARARLVLRTRPRPADIHGLRYAETTIAAPLGGSLLPRPQLGRVGMIATWKDDDALERFLAEHPLAERFRGGWHARLQVLRASGTWSRLQGLPTQQPAVEDAEPVAVLTLGRLRLRRVLPFLRASARAERQAVADPALLAATGLARPVQLVATFSLWRTASAMREYAYGANGEGHSSAIGAHRAEPFHHESVFIRLRPYASEGAWDGRDPLAVS
jgi:hypothetical protein